MPNEQLVAVIQEKYKKGERREEIRADLEAEGYDIGDINEAISYIQMQALKQLPVIAHIIQYFEYMEKKTANASPKVVVLVLLGAAGIVALISILLYVSLDPLGIKANERDTQRETDFMKLRTAIERYHGEKNVYPASLNTLMPNYISSIPQDPKTGGFYQYRVIEKYDYELCVVFETKIAQCLSTLSGADAIIPQVQNNTGQQVEGASDTNYHAL